MSVSDTVVPPQEDARDSGRVGSGPAVLAADAASRASGTTLDSVARKGPGSGTKSLPCDVSVLEVLARRHGTPYQLYDERGIRANARALHAAFRPRFPRFRQHFAVKALPNPAVLRVLVQEGCGLDCSSPAELYAAAAAGCAPEHVCYTSNFTSRADLATALAHGCVINLDDASLVDTLASVVAGGGVSAGGGAVTSTAGLGAVTGAGAGAGAGAGPGSPATRFPALVSFRLNPGVGRTDSSTSSNVLAGPDAKFGVAGSDIVAAYGAAVAHGATRFGMHMMTGSCVMSDAYWEESLVRLLDAVAQVRAALGIEFEFINVGGGLGIPYRDGEACVDVERLAGRMAAVIAERCAAHAMPVPALHMENGRYMTGPFGWLVARCQAVKRSYGHLYYGLDACMAHLMRPGMYDAHHHISVPAREPGATTPAAASGDGAAGADNDSGTESQSQHGVVANVVGTLCENNDWFAKQRRLPAAQVGDLFVIHDTGAHGHAMGFNYNGALRAPELLIRDLAAAKLGPKVQDASAAPPGVRVDVIRNRETVAGLFANCVSIDRPDSAATTD